MQYSNAPQVSSMNDQNVNHPTAGAEATIGASNGEGIVVRTERGLPIRGTRNHALQHHGLRP